MNNMFERETWFGELTVENQVEIKLKNKKAVLEKQLKEINEATKLLEDNPKILDIINALRKVGI